MTDNSQGTSLLHYKINYGHEKFYDTGPGLSFRAYFHKQFGSSIVPYFCNFIRKRCKKRVFVQNKLNLLHKIFCETFKQYNYLIKL